MRALWGEVDLRLAGGVWMRNLTIYRRTWVMNILPNFFEPVLYLLGMGVGLGAYVTGNFDGDSYIAFIGPGLMAAAAMNGATFETTYNMFVKMHYARLYDAYLSTPVTVFDLVVGELLWALSRGLIYGLGFAVVLLGFHLSGTPMFHSWYALLIPLVLALTGMVFGLIGQLFTATVPVIDLYAYYYTLWLTPLFLFSGVFFPVDRFPHGAEVAWCTPLFHAVRLMRELCHDGLTATAGVSALWLVALALVLLWLVPRRFEKRLAK